MDSQAHVCVTRHGETDWNAMGVLQGWLDVPINDEGRRQAHQLAVDFADAGFVSIVSSPLVRARETAEIIADALGLPPPEFDEGLKERNFGEIQGIPKSELAELNPVLLQQILKRNPATHFEHGETMDECADRILAAIMRQGERHAGQRVLIITHGWVMDVVTRLVRGLPRTAILNTKRKNGDSLWLEVDGHSIIPACDEGRLAGHGETWHPAPSHGRPQDRQRARGGR